MTEAVTEGIRVSVQPVYLAEQSDPDQERCMFAYQVRITNEGDAPAKLVSRHWIITDGLGRTEHVRGPGVVGYTPRLEPGQGFEYTSYCPLSTPTGWMHGTYQMVRDDGQAFDAKVEVFEFFAPRALN